MPDDAAPPVAPCSDVILALPINDACRALGIGRSSLYELIAKGRIKTARVGGRRLVPLSELIRLLDESTDRGARQSPTGPI